MSSVEKWKQPVGLWLYHRTVTEFKPKQKQVWSWEQLFSDISFNLQIKKIIQRQKWWGQNPDKVHFLNNVPFTHINNLKQNQKKKNPTVNLSSVWTHLDINNGNDALGLVKMPGHPVDRLWDIVQHQVEVHFIFLDRVEQKRETKTHTSSDSLTNTNPHEWKTVTVSCNFTSAE